MTDTVIDLNADLAEGFGRWTLTDDEALLSVVTSANIACGFHAGDPGIMHRVCDIAAERGVRIGAQVSYRDLAGFGRRPMDVPAAELADEITYQIGALQVFARAAGTAVTYVKPHGALYNRIVSDPEQAFAVAAAAARADPALSVLCLPGSALHTQARHAGLTPVAEAFADRAYTAAGTLVPRTSHGALITDPAQVTDRAVTLAREHRVTTPDGTSVPVRARSLCLHGDTPRAVQLAERVRAALEAAGVRIEAFT
ncbi:LamB/YcsF family protein [Streptomyces sp. NPDC003023]|uniref:LamB/YcsF family protein n=1 Tax=Streptomyces sp. NPDC003023 TaxID=3364675 RepID=UPI0036A241B9